MNIQEQLNRQQTRTNKWSKGFSFPSIPWIVKEIVPNELGQYLHEIIETAYESFGNSTHIKT